MCFSCLPFPLIPVIIALCPNSEQHQPSRPHLALRPFSSITYPVHPMVQSFPQNCFLCPGFVSHFFYFTSSTKLTHCFQYRLCPVTYLYASDAVLVIFSSFFGALSIISDI